MVAKAAKSERHKLKLVIGDGIHPVQGLLSPERITSDYEREFGKPPSGRQQARRQWDAYEVARFQTYNSCPSFGYFILFYLAKRGLISSIITTNYDLFFNSIADRLGDVWQINPAASPSSYSWEGYYSRPSPRKTPLWKIHGSLTHTVNKACPSDEHAHIFRLPNFPVTTAASRVSTVIRRKIRHNNLAYIGARYSISSLTSESGGPGVSCHYLDWAFNNDRSCFCREIDRATQQLKSFPSAPILLIGFTGYYDRRRKNPWNEELAPVVSSLPPRTQIFYLLKDEQAARLERTPPPSGSLYHKFYRSKIYYDVFSDAGEYLSRVLEASGVAKISALKRQYIWEWVNGSLFTPMDKLRRR